MDARPSILRGVGAGAPQAGVMRRLFRAAHEHLIDAIQAGRSDEAYFYARLLAYLGPRL